MCAIIIARTYPTAGSQGDAFGNAHEIKANIATGLKLYELDNGAFPTTDEGLDALFSQPSSASNWNGPYLESQPVDSWGREYQFESPGSHRPQGYDLYSLGKDGKEGNDDIPNWE